MKKHFATAEIAQSGSLRAGCTLLDKPVGSVCLASLLGIGDKRLRKAQSGAPDIRHGRRMYRSKPGSWSVDSFLQISYDRIAETLPDETLAPNSAVSTLCYRYKVQTSCWNVFGVLDALTVLGIEGSFGEAALARSMFH